MNLDAVLNAEWRFFPYNHQLREFEMRCDAEAVALAWHMRTGKTKAVIDKACYLYKRRRINAVLVFAPNGVHANWGEVEFPKHCWPSVPFSALVWRSAVAGAKAINSLPKYRHESWIQARERWWRTLASVKTSRRLMVLCINSESMTRDDARKAVARLIRYRKVMVVFDESDDFGIPGAKRTKMARALARRCDYRVIMSGTLSTATPLAVWSQFELLKPGCLGFDTYQEFFDAYAIVEARKRPGGKRFPYVAGFQNLDDLRKRMAPYTTVVLRKDVDDMPAIHKRERIIQPSEEQIEAFRQLRESWILELDDETIDTGEKAMRLRKMQQVFAGFVKDAQGKTHKIRGRNPRLDALAEEAYLAPGKLIIWCAYHEDMDAVESKLKACGIETVSYHGRVADRVKAKAQQTFREKPGKIALIGHVKSCGRGLDFSVASTVIWYTYDFAARLRQQGMERATAIGGGTIQSIDFIVGTGRMGRGPDRYILDTIEDRIDIADSLTGIGMKELLKRVSP